MTIPAISPFLWFCAVKAMDDPGDTLNLRDEERRQSLVCVYEGLNGEGN